MTENEFLERLRTSGKAEEALAEVERLGFARDFILKNVLVDSGSVNVAHVAMLWQGMPNKHDRKRTQALLDLLTSAGLLRHDAASDSWTLISYPFRLVSRRCQSYDADVGENGVGVKPRRSDLAAYPYVGAYRKRYGASCASNRWIATYALRRSVSSTDESASFSSASTAGLQ